jgi:hypothetical protein
MYVISEFKLIIELALKALIEIQRAQATGNPKFLEIAEEILQKCHSEISQHQSAGASFELNCALILLVLGRTKILQSFALEKSLSGITLLEKMWQPNHVVSSLFGTLLIILNI